MPENQNLLALSLKTLSQILGKRNVLKEKELFDSDSNGFIEAAKEALTFQSVFVGDVPKALKKRREKKGGREVLGLGNMDVVDPEAELILTHEDTGALKARTSEIFHGLVESQERRHELDLMLEGLPDKEIAQIVGIETPMVRYHRLQLSRKLERTHDLKKELFEIYSELAKR